MDAEIRPRRLVGYVLLIIIGSVLITGENWAIQSRALADLRVGRFPAYAFLPALTALLGAPVFFIGALGVAGPWLRRSRAVRRLFALASVVFWIGMAAWGVVGTLEYTKLSAR